jgi:RND family efflux transporter MFP subunit
VLFGRKRVARGALASVLIGIAALAMAACGSKDTVQAKNAGVSPASQGATVGVVRAEMRPLVNQLTVSSELVPFQEIDVYAKEPGYVKTLNVDYGSHVRKGQVMAILEVPELEAQLQEDQATIKARTDEVTRAQHQLSRDKAQHNVLHIEYKRLAGVAEKQPGLVAQQEVDDAQGKDLAAESTLEAAQGSLEAAQSEVAVSKAKLIHDQALYDYSKITAPFEGVVTQRYANFGALMQAGTSSTQATPLVRLSQENLFRLVIPVPEADVRYIRIGDAVQVRVPALNDTFTGRVTRFSVDVTSETRTMHTEVDVPNPNNKLVPGLYAEADLTFNQAPKAIAVPTQAVDREGANTTVMIVTDSGQIEKRPVTLGVQTANYAQIASGLKPGDEVVVSDRGSLKPGDRVTTHSVDAMVWDASSEDQNQ